MGSRFLTALLSSFALTLAVLGAAGYAVTVLTVPAPRELLRTAAFEFDLAPGWNCDREGTEWVCHPPRQEAVQRNRHHGDEDPWFTG